MKKDSDRKDAGTVKVSIVMPIYNAESHLAEALGDIRRQTHRNFEAILVDDGSTDDSSRMMQRLADEDCRFRYIWQENAGAGAARNAGLDEATGEYIIFLDADDRFEPNMIEKMATAVHDSGADICICRFANAYSSSEQEHVVKHKFKRELSGLYSGQDIRDSIPFSTYPVVWDKLIRRELIREHSIRFHEIRKHNDVYFANMCLYLARSIVFIDDILLRYRIENSKSLQDTANIYDTAKCVLPTYCKLQTSLKKAGLMSPGVKRGIDNRVLGQVTRAFKVYISDNCDARLAFQYIHDYIDYVLCPAKTSYPYVYNPSIAIQYWCLFGTSFQGLLSISGHFSRDRRQKNNVCKKALNAGRMMLARIRYPYKRKAES